MFWSKCLTKETSKIAYGCFKNPQNPWYAQIAWRFEKVWNFLRNLEIGWYHLCF